ncbi:MAG: glycoside hydrolase family 32 protein [Roseburia sp.]|jgi:sucrose-6-phosphate hydrolase SacC (GH32 family)|nr:glycoside hydrolase family 32 protein [Roseburia sp.]
MISQSLRDVRSYEEEMDRRIADAPRPAFHLSARTGWMNDPNGFSYYNGEYHLFYQYYPFRTEWGPMHWAHAVSKDLLHWRHLPAALAPDMDYDRDGCFSGSAVTLPDGRQLLMYTGVDRRTLPDGSAQDIQTQCIAVSCGTPAAGAACAGSERDTPAAGQEAGAPSSSESAGIGAGAVTDYEKYEGNPVLSGRDLPPGANRNDFRDPKLWRADDGTYYCVAGNRTEDRDGQILLFSSPDAFHWTFVTVLAKNNGRFGRMWECPDFFPLDGKQVLLISPQDMLPKDFEYHNGNGTVCIIGSYDKETHTFTEEANQAIDYGIDFYATQTLLTPDGRRILIAWMQNWDTCNFRSIDWPWFGQMCLPRELSLRDGRLIQQPLRELLALRKDEVRYENVTFTDLLRLDGIEGRRVDLTLSLRPGNEKELYRKFALRFAQDDTWQTSISFRPYESIVKIDRKFSGSRRAIIHQRRCRVRNRGGRIDLRVILDHFSVEIFVNDGEHVLTATLYTDLSARGISFFADGEVTMDVVKFALQDMRQ